MFYEKNGQLELNDAIVKSFAIKIKAVLLNKQINGLNIASFYKAGQLYYKTKINVNR